MWSACAFLVLRRWGPLGPPGHRLELLHVRQQILGRADIGREQGVENQFVRAEFPGGDDLFFNLLGATREDRAVVAERLRMERYVGTDDELEIARIAASFGGASLDSGEHLLHRP